MNETMLDRVAKAISEAQFGTGFDVLPEDYRVARAALEAMREPTEDMIAIGIDQAESCTDGWTASAPCIAEHLWPAMIAAALEEGK